MKKLTSLQTFARFVYESGILAKTPRSGLWFLGTGNQSVAEHTLRTAYIGYVLGYMTKGADTSKIILMALFHDFGEGRTSDLNHVHQKYGRLAESEAMQDLSKSVPFGKDMMALFNEAKDKKTLEAKLVKDADTIDWITTLREEEVKGNTKARNWINVALKRLKTRAGKQLAKAIIKEHPDSWWFSIHDKWFTTKY